MNTFEVRELTLASPEKILCDKLSFTCHPGEIWGVLGRNGSGKTTLLHALLGLVKPVSGTIQLKHRSITTIPRRELARQMAILLQKDETIYTHTVLEIALMGRYPHLQPWHQESPQDYAIARHSLEIMGLVNLETRRVATLSGGEQRRLAIAAILAQTPQFYLLDEPLHQLDINYQIQTLNHFRMLAKDHAATIVMSVHDINLALQYCDRFILLYGDGSFEVGNKDLLLNEEVIARLLQHRLRLTQTEFGPVWMV